MKVFYIIIHIHEEKNTKLSNSSKKNKVQTYMKKIIHILCHTLANDKMLSYHVLGNWAARQAQKILTYSDKYRCEVWYAVRDIKKSSTFIKSNITYRLFPAKTVNPLLESFYPIISCPSLLAALKKENPEKVGIHIQGERGSLLHTILKKFPQFIITLQYHGYGQPDFLNWLERLFITPQEKENFPHVRHFFVHIRRRIEYLQNLINIPPSAISFQNNGVDFDRFKPGNRLKARARLNIPRDAFVVLYVGAMTKTKGVDKIISAAAILKKKYPNLYLLLVGATKTDPLYSLAAHSADKLVHLIDNAELPDYYHAANVYCFYGNKKTVEYAGVGTAPTEALASNINVVSTNLIHLPDTIVAASGFVPKNFNDFVDRIEFLIQNPQFSFNARDIVYPYTSYQITTRNILRVYDRLFYQKT